VLDARAAAEPVVEPVAVPVTLVIEAVEATEAPEEAFAPEAGVCEAVVAAAVLAAPSFSNPAVITTGSQILEKSSALNTEVSTPGLFANDPPTDSVHVALELPFKSQCAEMDTSPG